MPDKKISQLDAAGTLTGSELVELVQSGGNVRTTVTALGAGMVSSGMGIPTVINAVTDYSAVGDGVTNDDPAIQAALNAASAQGGGIVYLPEGDFLLGTTASTNDVLQVPSNVTLRGAGRNVTILRSASAQAGVRPVAFFPGASYARIDHLSVVANTGTVGSVGIQFPNSQHCVVDDCYISADFGWGVQLTANCAYTVVSNTELAGTTFSNCYENNGSSYNTLIGCHLHDSARQLVEIADKTDAGWGATQDPLGYCIGNQVINNFLIDSGGGAIQTMGDKATVISGNTIIGAVGHGIFVEPAEFPLDDSIHAEGLTITGNTIRDCGVSGITMGFGTETCIISNNTIEGTLASGEGINSQGLSHTISHNTCRLNDGNGIYVIGARATVIGNVCLNNSGVSVGGRSGLNIGGDYCRVIGNIGSDDRGGSARQEFGTIVSGTTGVTAIGNGGTGNTGGAFYDGGTASYTRGNEGANDSSLGLTLGVGGAYVGAAGESLSVKAEDAAVAIAVYDTASDLHYTIWSSGDTFHQPDVATGGATTKDSPFQIIRSARWNGSASVFEDWQIQVVRSSASQYGNAIHFLNSASSPALILGDGAEGSVSVGTTVPGPSGLTTIGKLHVQPGAATTVGASVKQFSGQTANLLAFYDTAGDVLTAVAASGNVVLTADAARLKFGSAAHHQTTVGAAGGASALPATPSQYVKILVEGTEYVIPAYAVS